MRDRIEYQGPVHGKSPYVLYVVQVVAFGLVRGKDFVERGERWDLVVDRDAIAGHLSWSLKNTVKGR